MSVAPRPGQAPPERRGRHLTFPACFNARHLSEGALVENATLGGAVPLWEWIGDERRAGPDML
jgi:hypothetical protein